MKLLFVFTGGTIGSVAEDGVIRPSQGAPYRLLAEYEKTAPLDFSYDVLSPYTALSENNTGEHIGCLLRLLTEKISGYDGVVVTHGTDTLAYTAAALGYALGNDTPPLCLVSAGKPLSHPASNGVPNLAAALGVIRSGASGVLVPYRNGEGPVFVHRATRLAVSTAFGDALYGVGDLYGQWEDNAFCKSLVYKEREDALGAPASLSLAACPEGVVRVFAYPGMSYPALTKEISAVLLDPYHSGTVDTASEAALRFYGEAKEKGIPVYVTGATGEDVYASAAVFSRLGITPLPRLAPAAAYMKLWLYGTDKETLLLSRGGDIF